MLGKLPPSFFLFTLVARQQTSTIWCSRKHPICLGVISPNIQSCCTCVSNHSGLAQATRKPLKCFGLETYLLTSASLTRVYFCFEAGTLLRKVSYIKHRTNSTHAEPLHYPHSDLARRLSVFARESSLSVTMIIS